MIDYEGQDVFVALFQRFKQATIVGDFVVNRSLVQREKFLESLHRTLPLEVEQQVIHLLSGFGLAPKQLNPIDDKALFLHRLGRLGGLTTRVLVLLFFLLEATFILVEHSDAQVAAFFAADFLQLRAQL